MTSRKPLLITATLLAMTLAASMVAAPVLAAPHFVGTPTIIAKNSDGSLIAQFKAAGLANIVTGAFLTSSGGNAVLQCINPGGNNPPPKEVTFGPVRGQQIFFKPNNGQITGIVVIGPPPLPTASQICPNSSWSIQLVSLTYLNLVLHVRQFNADVLLFNFGTVTVPQT